MKRTPINDLFQHVGQTVCIEGFVGANRNLGRMQFLAINDGTGTAQIANDKKGETGQLFAESIKALTKGSTVRIEGTVTKLEKSPFIEVIPSSVTATSHAEAPLPIQADSSLDLQMDHRHVSLRDPKNHLIFCIQTTFEHALREFWVKRGFVEIHSPKLMGTPSESGAELFELDYFGRKAYLAQSPQFYKQMAMAAGMGSVFEIGPVFRANPSFTSRHDTEFTSVDMEMSWVNSHEDVMAMEEALLTHAFKQVKKKHGKEIQELFGINIKVPSTPFPRIAFADAIQLLEKQFNHKIPAGSDLDPQGERYLHDHFRKTTGHDFVFVTDYPAKFRAFYHMRYPDRPDTTKSFDLLYRGLEITTGAQREHRLDVLAQQAAEKGLSQGPLQHYFNFFRHGCPPHGGCGIGLTRILMKMLDLENVRQVTFLYRGPNRLEP
jgi:nondiscriminating aspartyl-tRNA synthetase